MIESRADLKYYMERDRLADNYSGTFPTFIGSWNNTIWRYKIFLRKAEYYKNLKNKSFFSKIIGKYYLFCYTSLGIKLGFTIPLNVIEEGLSLPHYGTIIINGNSRVGKNCRIMADVVIGSTSGVNTAAVIGDNVYIGAGTKVIGAVSIGNDVMIGANSVITKNIGNSVTVAGVPAKKISDKSSRCNLSSTLFAKR